MKFKNIKTNNSIIARQEFIDTLTDASDWYEVVQAKPLEQLQQDSIIKLHSKYDKFFKAYKESYPEGEQSSFDDKRKEALAWKLDDTSPTPVCDTIATARGEDRLDFLQSVYDAVIYLTYQEGSMIKVRDAIKAATTEDELDAIEIPTFPVD